MDATAEVTIEPVRDAAMAKLLAEAKRLPWSQDTVSTPSYLLSLSDALAVAVHNSREYQTRKEGLFSQALGLTGTRRDYRVSYSASSDYRRSRVETGHGTAAGGAVEHFSGRG